MQEYQGTEVQRFNHIYKELDELYHDIALKIGISDSALAVLYTVCVLGEGCLQRDVCREAYISKQTVNSSVRTLERSGYIFLEQSGGRDKRIWLTETGKRFVDERIRQIPEMESEAFLEMTEEERSEFIRLSEKYVDNFRRKERKILEEMT